MIVLGCILAYLGVGWFVGRQFFRHYYQENGWNNDVAYGTGITALFLWPPMMVVVGIVYLCKGIAATWKPKPDPNSLVPTGPFPCDRYERIEVPKDGEDWIGEWKQ